MDWKQYQQHAAAFFARLGLDAKVELEVEGARGAHKVDVFVTGSYHGINFSWVIECKNWKSNVPKEKVMALSAIVQDIGADRGFLLSETGFQSGAIRAAQKTNITLTSIEDLSDVTIPHVRESLIGAISWKVSKAKSRLMHLRRQSEAYKYDPSRVEIVGELSIVEFMLEEASENKFSLNYPVRNLSFSSIEELFDHINKWIEAAENWAGEPRG